MGVRGAPNLFLTMRLTNDNSGSKIAPEALTILELLKGKKSEQDKAGKKGPRISRDEEVADTARQGKYNIGK